MVDESRSKEGAKDGKPTEEQKVARAFANGLRNLAMALFVVSIAFPLVSIWLPAEWPRPNPIWVSVALAAGALVWWWAQKVAKQLSQPANISFPKPPTPDWSEGKVESSLQELFDHCIKRGGNAIDWYTSAKSKNRFWARALRMGAIILVAVGGVLPMLSEMVSNGNGPADPDAIGIPPGLSAVAFAVAGMLVILDRFFGYSSAWMRYVLTEAKIQTMLEAFAVGWQMERSSWQAPVPTAEERKKLVQRADVFLSELRKTIEAETAAWAEEFKSALNEIDKKAKEDTEAFRKEMREKLDKYETAAVAERQASATGSIRVEVDNGDQCAAGWALQIGDASQGTKTGKRAVVTDVKPGQYRVFAEGTISGRSVSDEDGVDVKPSAFSDVKLSLLSAAAVSPATAPTQPAALGSAATVQP